ncbi:DUF5342 family protein [Virgibacillus salidurans]|uniref:DUF5342 family protein n=1 Tax=Virgibacillus salidurans TaxID=2831673 RepID=UPI001F44D33D|nr:DUF5342 family protein [Virgibacillus sp. NKC19-16]
MADEMKPDVFEEERVFKKRTYERRQFSLSVDGKEYKGYFHDGEIQWLNPHPKQDLGDEQLDSLETEIHELMEERGVKDETDDIQIKPMFDDKPHDDHVFKLTIQGNEYTGVFRDGQLQWHDPKPTHKLKEKRVKKIEGKIYEKVKEKKKE